MEHEGHRMNFGLAKIFNHEELKEATNNFDSSRVLGSGGFGKVYLGKLNGKMVAVKKLFDNNPSLVEQFLNEVSVLSRIRHQNLVTLHGCTNPRSEDLLLVYDFVPNGTVAEHLHCQESTLTWYMRIQIAVQTAQVLAYLHALEPPVIHRDVKTSNILLDDAFHAKVADFGICRLMPWDATHITTLPQGTMGYRDPEYDRTMRLTDKSDVYSFGVVLLELMSGMQAVDVYRGLDNIYLDVMAHRMIKGNKLKELVDSKLNYHSDSDSRRMINSVAELACECLRPEGKLRPTMVQVLKALTDIQDKRYKIDDKNVDGAQAYVFSHNELSQATESFHESRHLGKKTYIGNFDGLTVAVKVRQVKKLGERAEMFNDVKVLSQLRHENLATLYGSTDPGSKEMLLVYEYVTNGSVGHHLHGPHPEHLLQKEEQIALDWALRMRIAIETAEAVSYLHSLDPPVIHHEISTYNILLDDNCHVILSGLNLDRDNTCTLGYEDSQWSEFFTSTTKSTTKYDVFSFGVVLLELISRKEAFFDEYGSHGWGTSRVFLARWASKMIQRNELGQLVDKELNYHINLDTKKMVTSVAELACRCVQPKGKMRPTMSEVLLGLKQIKMSSILPPLSAVTMELQLRSSGEVPKMGSVLGRVGSGSPERAVGVFDLLGIRMSNLNPGSGSMFGLTTRGNKISILAFEVANTITKASNLLRSLSDENIVFMKEEILKSDGVRELISGDSRELLSIASSDKREELNVFCREVTRFGDMCKDPSWHNLGRRLNLGLAPQDQHRKAVETTMQQLLSLAKNTFELYHELNALDKFEQDRQKLRDEESLPDARRKSLLILQRELKRQRKHVGTLKKRSLWSRNLEEVVEKLVGIVAFLHQKIVAAFGVTDTYFVNRESVHKQTLGASGLALHYANIITKIDSIVSRPLSIPPDIRDTLYHGLPARVKAVLRTRLQPYYYKEEYTVAQIKATMEKSLRWIVPMAENTIKAHQVFGRVGVWANICNYEALFQTNPEHNKKLAPQHNISRIQTLHHANQKKTEEHMLELVVWLHHLVIPVKNREFGFNALKPIQSRSQKNPLLPAAPNGRSSTMFELSKEERELLVRVSSNKPILVRSKSQQVLSSKEKPILVRSKSQQVLSSKEKRGKNRYSNRSCDSSPVKSFYITRAIALDVIDRVDMIETFPR